MKNNQDLDFFITGDFCLINKGEKALKEGKADSIIDTSPFQQADYLITNFEAPAINNGSVYLKVGPALKNPEESVAFLKSKGFNLLCLANNHLMDYGEEGLMNTLRICEAEKMPVIGGGINLDAAKKPFIAEKNGYKVALINMAENEFGEATPERKGFFAYNPITAHNAIKEAKKQADDVIVLFHGGHEHYTLPSPAMQERYRFLVDSGASAVVANHTHCFCGHEEYNNGVIFYSLGNFIFDFPATRKPQANLGVAVKLNMSKGKKPKFELVPYNQFVSEAKVEFLIGQEKEEFDREATKKNEIITAPGKIRDNWSQFVASHEKKYLTYLEVPNHKYFRGARFFRLIPGWLTRRHKALILNMMRCDSHREALLSILKKNIKY